MIINLASHNSRYGYHGHLRNRTRVAKTRPDSHQDGFFYSNRSKVKYFICPTGIL